MKKPVARWETNVDADDRLIIMDLLTTRTVENWTSDFTEALWNSSFDPPPFSSICWDQLWHGLSTVLQDESNWLDGEEISNKSIFSEQRVASEDFFGTEGVISVGRIYLSSVNSFETFLINSSVRLFSWSKSYLWSISPTLSAVSMASSSADFLLEHAPSSFSDSSLSREFGGNSPGFDPSRCTCRDLPVGCSSGTVLIPDNGPGLVATSRTMFRFWSSCSWTDEK